jgi:TPR repeat protein
MTNAGIPFNLNGQANATASSAICKMQLIDITLTSFSNLAPCSYSGTNSSQKKRSNNKQNPILASIPSHVFEQLIEDDLQPKPQNQHYQSLSSASNHSNSNQALPPRFKDGFEAYKYAHPLLYITQVQSTYIALMKCQGRVKGFELKTDGSKPTDIDLRAAHYQAGQTLTSGVELPPNLKRGVLFFQWAAAGGHPEAQFELGDAYEYGKGVEIDLRKSFEFYQLAAQGGSLIGMHALSLSYYYGDGTDVDLKESTRVLRRAAEAGFELSQLEMGVRLENGEGVDKDFKSALKWYLVAAEQGNVEAIHSVGRFYSNGHGMDGGEADWEVASRYFKKAAMMGHCPSKVSLGRRLEFGLGGSKVDVDEALKLYREAALEDDKDALFALGQCYRDGKGVKADSKTAFLYFLKASLNGQVEAQCSLARCYMKGEGTAVNYVESFEWYKLAEKEGKLAEAQYYMGYFYSGLGGGKTLVAVGVDMRRAIKYFKLAAAQGHVKATAQLGSLLMKGKGCVKDYAESFVWLKKASELGDLWAKANLAKLYRLGLGAQKDEEECCKLLKGLVESQVDVLKYGWKVTGQDKFELLEVLTK